MDSKVVVFGEDYCPYCQKVKEIFNGLKVAFNYKVRSQHQDEFNQLSQTYKHTTIPLVLINGQFIGGCSDVQKLQSEGKLNGLLGI